MSRFKDKNIDCNYNYLSDEQVKSLYNILSEKYKNKKIIMGCGCFEIFHIGHLEYLEGAKKLGDILVIGVNPDEYIINHKNRKSKFPLEERMKILDAIKYVDYVFPFYENTFERSLEIIKPSVFAKGIDRKIVLEQEICNQNGIKVVKIGKEKKSSATELREYI